MEPEEDKKCKKVNDDTVIFLRKRSETETPRYAARLRAYVDLHRKRSRAAAARRRSEQGERKTSTGRKKGEADQKENMEKSHATPTEAHKCNCGLSGEHPGAEDDRISRRRGGDKAGLGRTRSRSVEPSDRCCRRRKKRRSCSRRRRRRRSCRRRRRRSRRRRRRSCRRRRSRRRRRRSCRRRRKRRRRC